MSGEYGLRGITVVGPKGFPGIPGRDGFPGIHGLRGDAGYAGNYLIYDYASP